MKYKYHIILWFSEIRKRFFHSFESDNDILKMSEIRNQIEGRGFDDCDGFTVENISKTIND
jgi:hypothetical protein